MKEDRLPTKEIARQLNVSVIGQSMDDPEKERQIITTMKNYRVDGIIVSLGKHTKSYEHFTALEKYKIHQSHPGKHDCRHEDPAKPETPADGHPDHQ